MMRLLTLVGRSAAQAKAIIVGAVVVLAGIQVLIVAQAASIERSRSFGVLADLMPGFLQRGFGSQALLLATFQGTVSFGYFHPVFVCLVALVAMYITTEPAYEVETGLVDLVLARSVPRRRVLTRSLLLAMAAVAVVAIGMLVGTAVGLRWLAPDSRPPSRMVLATLALNLAAVAWCCAAIGLFVAASSRRWTTAFTTCAAIVVIGYLVDFLAIGWAPARTVAWLFPFNYYPALPILAGTANTPRDLATLLTATAVFAALAYWRFETRDL